MKLELEKIEDITKDLIFIFSYFLQIKLVYVI